MSNWIKEAIFYHIYPLGFCGCEQYHSDEVQHRLHKLEDWIPHLKELHINALYLGPLFSSTEHGYDTNDYNKIDERLGDHADFKKLSKKLHDEGIRIILDGVFNHVGRGFWAFQDVIEKKESSPYANWFHNINFTQNSPFGDPFTYEAWEGHYNLVKLNLNNEEVVQHLLHAVGMWMDEFHIDGLRLDAANCIDPNFFKRLKAFCKEKNPDFWLMGEIIHGDYTRWANNEMLDSVTNYECYKGLYSSHNEKNYFEIAYSLNRQFGNGGIYKDLTLYNFVDNHDVNRLASTVKRKEDLKNIYTLMYTMPGIPSLYYGSEWGLEGKKHNGSDADLRPCIDIKDMMNTPLLNRIKKLGAIRMSLSNLHDGEYNQILVKNEQFVFRRGNEQPVYIALNVSDEDAEVCIPIDNDLKNLLSDEIINCKDGNVILRIQAHDSCILVQSDGIDVPKAKETQHEQDITPLKEIIPGRYRHFKGRDYAVLYIAKHSESLEEYVVYRQLYGDETVWIRPLSMFTEMVEVDGNRIPRFMYIDE